MAQRYIGTFQPNFLSVASRVRFRIDELVQTCLDNLAFSEDKRMAVHYTNEDRFQLRPLHPLHLLV